MSLAKCLTQNVQELTCFKKRSVIHQNVGNHAYGVELGEVISLRSFHCSDWPEEMVFSWCK